MNEVASLSEKEKLEEVKDLISKYLYPIFSAITLSEDGSVSDYVRLKRLLGMDSIGAIFEEDAAHHDDFKRFNRESYDKVHEIIQERCAELLIRKELPFGLDIARTSMALFMILESNIGGIPKNKNVEDIINLAKNFECNYE